MKICYLGQQSLLDALTILTRELLPQSTITPYRTIKDITHDGYELLVIDSPHFKAVVADNVDLLRYPVLVLGHYTDTFAQQAFCISEQIQYLSYSRIESDLPIYLKELTSVKST